MHHAHLWGKREVKYEWLGERSVSDSIWADLEPTAPYYLFTERDVDLAAEYEQGWKITEAMPVNVLGFQSHRDDFAVDLDEQTLRDRMTAFRDSTFNDDEIKARFELKDNRDWQVSQARQRIRRDAGWKKNILRCLYRPFDVRWCYFDAAAMDYPRRELLDHVAGKSNLCLNTVRQTKVASWQHAIVTDSPAPAVFVEVKDGSNLFPLYLYPTVLTGHLLSTDEHTSALGGRRPNLSANFIADFSARLKLAFIPDGKGDRSTTFGPEDVFAYAYAIFHAPSYRHRYAEFLKIDFPRLPLTRNVDLFRQLCALGDELVGLHLMERQGPQLPGFPYKGSAEVDKVRYSEPADGVPGRVWINAEQCFEGVAPEVWAFHVGGYQVAHKWLKDRKGRTLSHEDLTHYRRTLAALSETIRLMAEVDEAIEAGGGWPLK